MKTGRSTTSFHPATGNPIMTSTTYNRYVEPATDESKTAPSKGWHGVTLGSNRGRGRKGVGARILRAINDLLPRSIRPIKSRRERIGIRYPLRVRLFTFRMLWHSHYKRELKNKWIRAFRIKRGKR